MEIDEVVVNSADWDAMLGGDKAARKRIQEAIDQVFLYFHILNYSDDERVVTIRDLEAQNLVAGVVVHIQEPIR